MRAILPDERGTPLALVLPSGPPAGLFRGMDRTALAGYDPPAGLPGRLV